MTGGGSGSEHQHAERAIGIRLSNAWSVKEDRYVIQVKLFEPCRASTPRSSRPTKSISALVLPLVVQVDQLAAVPVAVIQRV
eukprot:Skav209589  [mRNA]  locus=scaffold1607:87508:88973:- [translate_table: standard]